MVWTRTFTVNDVNDVDGVTPRALAKAGGSDMLLAVSLSDTKLTHANGDAFTALPSGGQPGIAVLRLTADGTPVASAALVRTDPTTSAIGQVRLASTGSAAYAAVGFTGKVAAYSAKSGGSGGLSPAIPVGVPSAKQLAVFSLDLSGASSLSWQVVSPLLEATTSVSPSSVSPNEIAIDTTPGSAIYVAGQFNGVLKDPTAPGPVLTSSHYNGFVWVFSPKALAPTPLVSTQALALASDGTTDIRSVVSLGGMPPGAFALAGKVWDKEAKLGNLTVAKESLFVARLDPQNGALPPQARWHQELPTKGSLVSYDAPRLGLSGSTLHLAAQAKGTPSVPITLSPSSPPVSFTLENTTQQIVHLCLQPFQP